LLLGLAVVVGLAWGGAEIGLNAEPSPRRGDPDRVFRQHCARCHGDDFTGAAWRDDGRRIPDFTSGAWQASRSDGQLLASIREGKGLRMPAFAGQLNDEQVRDLLLVIRRAGPARPAAAMISAPAHDAAFTRRYAALCAELEALRKEYRELQDEAEKEEKQGR
jgi:mono/diheme cytochrome c family protein